MTKILILGISGSGKTTLARKLSRRFQIPHFNLDDIFWENEKNKPYTKKRDSAEREKLVSAITQENPDWIIEGNYTNPWTDAAYIQADHIYYLKTNCYLRHYRIIKRYICIAFGKEEGQNGSLKSLIELLIYNQKIEKIQLQKVREKIENLKKTFLILK